MRSLGEVEGVVYERVSTPARRTTLIYKHSTTKILAYEESL